MVSVPGDTDSIVSGVVPATSPLMTTDEPAGRESTRSEAVVAGADLGSRVVRDDGAEIGES